MIRCPRCPNWAPDPDRTDHERDLLDEHADLEQHPRCGSCARILRPDETGTCEPCLARAQETLAGIALMWDELPHHLGQVSAVSSGGGSHDGRPLPGGDVLVLLGPGSPGLAETGETSRPTDPPSVAFDLGYWEGIWRTSRQEPAQQPAGSLGRAVRRSLGYLETRMRWAATSHPGFPAFTDDLRQLHHRLEQATGRLRLPTVAGATCFDCRGTLRYLIDTDGFQDPHATCELCGRQYEPSAYLLALRAAVEQAGRQTIDGERYATPQLLAHDLERSEHTVRAWARHGQARRVTVIGVGLLVHEADVQALDQARPRRRRTA